MSATVKIQRWTGTTGSPTKTDVTSINSRMNAEDTSTTAGTSNSILIPSAGTNYSYWASFRLNITAIVGGTVNNIKFFTDGANSFGTGISLKASTATAYAQATGTAGTSGTQLTTGNYATLAGAPVDAFTYTSGSPLAIAGSASATGDVGDFLVLQIEVVNTAASGATAQETMTLRYDDTSS
jgi:hypothetical protein